METAPVHHAARRRSGVAARGACAAAGETADHRILGRYAFGLRLLCSDSANSLGPTVATSRLSIAGQRAAMSATQQSRPSSSGSRSMSLSRREPHQSLRRSKRQRSRRSGRCPFRKSYPDIMVVQPGQDWDSDNGAGPLDCPTCGRVFAKRQVRPDLIVVGRISRKNLPQMRLAEDQHPVQALAAHGANQTLYIRVSLLKSPQG